MKFGKVAAALLMVVALAAVFPCLSVAGEEAVALYYDFSRITDGRVPDLSGNGHHGRVEGEPRPVEGGLRLVDGSRIVIPAVDSMNVGGGGFILEMVLETDPDGAWTPPGEDGHPYLLHGVYDESPDAWNLYLGCMVKRSDYLPGHVRFRVGDSSLIFSTAPVPAGVPAHITGARYDDGRVELYINGRIAGASAGGAMRLDNNRRVIIGASEREEGVAARHFEGKLRELRLHARALAGGTDPVLKRGREYLPAEDKAVTKEKDVIALGISFNGRDVKNRKQPLGFEPGRMNRLAVSPEGEIPLEVTVARHTPDGRVKKASETASSEARAEFLLGPMTAPPAYEFERGVVYRRGYRLVITMERAGEELFRGEYYQGLSGVPLDWRYGDPIRAGVERLLPGSASRVKYNPLYGVERAVDLRLHEGVLADPDNVRVLLRLNAGALVDDLRGRLAVTSEAGDVLYEQQVEVSEGTTGARLNVGEWPAGDYGIAFYPEMGGRVWQEGPSVTYRRRFDGQLDLPVVPPAPWRLERDPAREEVRVNDFREIEGKWFDSGGSWQTDDGGRLVHPPVEPGEGKPLRIAPGLSGYYAVFARGDRHGCLVKPGDKPFGIPLHTSQEVFLWAGDMTGGAVDLYPFEMNVRADGARARTGLSELLFVPVTGQSARAFRKETSRPELDLFGVTDWTEMLFRPVRFNSDQFDVLGGGQVDVGFGRLGWAIGRSALSYHSSLPEATRWPSIPLEDADLPRGAQFRLAQYKFINELECPLEAALAGRKRTGAEIWPWLAMNRHYGEGRIQASNWFVDNPQWRRWRKNAIRADRSEVSYFFDEVKQERVNILLELAGKGPDGLVVGAVRQVPMLLYNPEMVAEYYGRTGVNPQEIDAADREAYENWISWRADHFTEVLRMLRRGLDGLETENGGRISVAARIPSAGLFYNLAQGLDVEAWLEEGLVDILLVHPLEDRGGRGSHDITPYVELGGMHGVDVYGGIGFLGRFHAAAFRRGLGLVAAGVDGIEHFMTEYGIPAQDSRWLLPVFGNPGRMRELLEETNIEAVDPITASTAMAGHDNHSAWRLHGYSVYGVGSTSL